MFKVLDVSCFDPPISDRAHALTGALVKASARTIEKRFLREGGTAWRSGLTYRRGGLPPGALKRVQQYVEDHLAERVSSERLAAIAGLSVFHFVRVFKQSQGMTPHRYQGCATRCRCHALFSFDARNGSLARAPSGSWQSEPSPSCDDGAPKHNPHERNWRYSYASVEWPMTS